ncbi:glycosyltransferase family 4 protein [Dactylosporangium sp. CS-033363]|uniref:glycosyltransferase family 4 protein n=1 Tax=Dactylosporangium sp. CS-033363 TaxID=3239935 RepID=UPI003D93BD54
MTDPDRHLLIVAPDLANNSLARAYCLWSLARAAGWTAGVAAVRGESIWAPLAGTEFAAACTRTTAAGLAVRARGAAALVAVKPLAESLGLAVRARGRRPLWVDIDDPDLEVRHFGKPRRDRLSLAARTPGYWVRLHALRALARRLPCTVSNPLLGARYGGALIPHVRHAFVAEGPAGRSDGRAREGMSVVFAGTPRPHKGLEELRRAVAELQGDGVTLTVTAEAPDDARPWERWTGATSLAEGERLVRAADVVALPTRPEGWGLAQLPAKLVDAMMAGVAVVATDVGPNRWALGDTGLLVPPGRAVALTAALRRCLDPALRADLGARANARARARFSIEALTPVFAAFLEARLRDR